MEFMCLSEALFIPLLRFVPVSNRREGLVTVLLGLLLLLLLLLDDKVDVDVDGCIDDDFVFVVEERGRDDGRVGDRSPRRRLGDLLLRFRTGDAVNDPFVLIVSMVEELVE